jgi:alkylation response protein AidB-like acyl-CoA dehydrogenase
LVFKNRQVIYEDNIDYNFFQIFGNRGRVALHFFEFSEELILLRKAVREFVEAEVAPNAAKWDERDECPVDVFKKLGELGVNGIFVPEKYGGAGLGHVARAI